MPSFQHNGNAIHFADEGPRDGLPMVFSNSLGTDFRAWEPLLPHLPKGLRIVRYDKAGHGLSDFAGDRTIEAHAEDVAALLDHVGIERAVVVGLSVGGLIAQAFANANPGRTMGLALCDTGHKIGTQEIWNPRIEAINAGGMNAVLEPTMERWFTPRYRAESPDFPIWCNMLTRTMADGYCAVARAIRDADFTVQTRGIKAPTVCVVGAQDGATPPALVQELADLIEGAKFVQIEDCGHLPCIEQPEALATAIEGLLVENGLGV